MGVFTHLKVVELAGILAGPAVGMFFAELGADVVKLERPGTGDPTRGWRFKGESTPEDLSAYFCSINWGKRSMLLDLKTQRGLLDRMLAQTDVLLINFRPGSGLDTKELLERFPRLIIGSVTGYGADDARPGFDALIQAESGFMDLNGFVHSPDGNFDGRDRERRRGWRRRRLPAWSAGSRRPAAGWRRSPRSGSRPSR